MRAPISLRGVAGDWSSFSAAIKLVGGQHALTSSTIATLQRPGHSGGDFLCWHIPGFPLGWVATALSDHQIGSPCRPILPGRVS
jgi:hypothetical protein